MIDKYDEYIATPGKIRTHKEKCLIQVAYKIDTEEVHDREYGAFKNIKDGSPRFVFSLDEFDSSNNGITHLNIVDFLLNKVDISLS